MKVWIGFKWLRIGPVFHCHILKTPPLDPILSHLKPVYKFTTYFSKTHFNNVTVVAPATRHSG
jgi:hypothetical protein